MQSKQRRVYVNSKQLEFLNAKQKRRSFVGGRGSGKSTVYGHVQNQRFNYLPRGKVFTAGLTYNQILTKTLPSAMDAWDALGLKEYDKKTGLGHYVVGVKPPSDWFKPYQPPRNYENAITFINGFTIEMLSMDRPDSNRGGNYDGGDADESALLKEDQVNKVLLPMIRGNIYRFNHPLHHSFFDYTSAPWLPSGQWVYKTEDLAKEDKKTYKFVESTAYDNVAVLGQDYLAKLKKEMTKLEWDVEVMNKRLTKLPNSFYPAFSEDRHMRFDTYSYDQDEESGIWTTGNSFYNHKLPLETSWDFNAAFTSTIICQDMGNEFRIVNELYIEDDTEVSKVDALTDLFIKEYENHQCKEVYIYGDRNGNNKSPGDTRTFYEKIMDKLRAKGWEPTLMVQGLDPDHMLKHIFLNEMLSEKNQAWPVIRMDQNRCKWLAISITNSPIKPDWRKDKNSERLLIDQKRATHLSDCFIAGTLIMTIGGQKKIEDVQVGDLVLTRKGWKPVVRAWLSRRNAEVGTYLVAGREITCTPDHRFWTNNRGWVEAGHLTASDILCTLEETIATLCKQRTLNSAASSLSAIQTQRPNPIQNTLKAGGAGKMASWLKQRCTVPFGCKQTVLSLKGTTSTTWTGTTLTTPSLTWPASLLVNTLESIGKKSRMSIKMLLRLYLSLRHRRLRKTGTAPMKVVSGTGSIAFNSGKKESLLSVPAPGVATSTRLKTSVVTTSSIARENATPMPGTIAELITRKEAASSVAKPLLLTNTSKQEPAQAHALRTRVGQANVYDLSVEGEHEFFANGVLVHNCFDNITYRKYSHLSGNAAPAYQVYFLGRT